MPLGPYRRITKQDAREFAFRVQQLRQKIKPTDTMKTIEITVYKYDEYDFTAEGSRSTVLNS